MAKDILLVISKVISVSQILLISMKVIKTASDTIRKFLTVRAALSEESRRKLSHNKGIETD